MVLAKNSLLKWSLLTVVYLIVLLVVASPIASRYSSTVLGLPNDDLFDEMVLQNATWQEVQQGNLPLYTNVINFPLSTSWLITHKSYLHVLLAFPTQCLDWPQWWNTAILSAILISALTAAAVIARLSSSFWAGGILALPFLFLPWTRSLVAWGHLPQMWSAPLFIAVFFLAAVILQKRSKAAIWLAFFTAITALVYWIWGFLLALLGLMAVVFELPRLNRRVLVSTLMAIMLVGCLVGQIGYRIISIDRQLPSVSVQGGLTKEQRQEALDRAKHNGLGKATDVSTQYLPWSELVLPSLGVIMLGMLIWGWRQGNQILFWTWAALAFFLLGIGPYLAWGDTTWVDSQGNPVLMPFFYLAKYSGLGYRWQLPNTVTPLMMICITIASALAVKNYCRWRTVTTLVIATVLLAATEGLALYGLDQNESGNANTESTADLGPSIDSYLPMHPAIAPAFAKALRDMPPGAALEMPLGYTPNTWQIQPQHNHPTCNGKRPISFVILSNDFALLLLRLNKVATEGLQLASLPGNHASELPYGSTVVPSQYGPDVQRGQVPPERYIDKELVSKAYAKIYIKGLRYVVLHRRNCNWLVPGQGQRIYNYFHIWLLDMCGKPLYEDQQTAIFALPKPAKLDRFWAKQPWDRLAKSKATDFIPASLAAPKPGSEKPASTDSGDFDLKPR